MNSFENSIVRTILPQVIAVFLVTGSAVSQAAPNPPAPTRTAATIRLLP